MSSATELVAWMKAAGEPSRLRLLALCCERDLSVTDLGRALKQSGPRVSRHLKILCAAGLLERVRQGQWVHYQLSRKEAAVQFVRVLLAQLNRDDAVLVKDRQQARFAEDVSAPVATAGTKLGRSMRAFIESHREAERLDSALVIGAHHVELLEAASNVAAECVAVMPSRRAVQAARTYVEDHDLACRVGTAVSGTHSAVIIEHLSAPIESLPQAVGSAQKRLSAQGRLWLFVRYEALESARAERVVEHPLARLRRLLSEAGFSCRHMSPIEADGEHLLCAVADRVAAAPRTRPASVA